MGVDAAWTEIIELFGYAYRLQYKVEKRKSYWPKLPPGDRLQRIVKNLRELRNRLCNQIDNVGEFFLDLDTDRAYSIRFLKAYEDVVDALVCGLVGWCFSQGRATPFGDEEGVIWVPMTKKPDSEGA